MKYSRMQIWQHNGFFGHARMMQTNAQSIANSVTASKTSKNIAAQIAVLAEQLSASLKTRAPLED